MKTQLTLTFALLLSFIGFAQNGINYKAIIKDGSGAILSNSLVVVQFSIIENSISGSEVYVENHTPTTDENGLVILNIGEGTTISGTFSTIDWGSDAHFLNVQVNTGGGLTDLGTTQFSTVPYALNALSIPAESLKINDLMDGKANATTIALGADAGLNNSNASGVDNTFIGVNAGKMNTSGNNNTFLGANAGSSVTNGIGNVIIGSSAGSGTNYSEKLIVDNSNTTTPLIYGDFQSNKLFVNRNFPISAQEAFGITAPANAGDYGGMYIETKGSITSRPFYGFAIDGTGYAWMEFDGDSQDVIVNNIYGNFKVQYNTATKPTAGSWSGNSDKRLKKKIVPLDKEEMLQKIMQMEGVSYEWNDSVTEYERPTGKQIGFIAQDLQKIWPEKVSKDHLGYLQTAYGDYDPVIIEAIKALHDKIENQEKEMNLLKKKLLKMEDKIEK